MYLFTESRWSCAALLVSLTVVGAACGSGTDAADVDAESAEQATTSAAPDSTTTVSVATTVLVEAGPATPFAPSADPHPPGTYRGAFTDVSIRFTIPDSDGSWRGVHTDEWHLVLLFASGDPSPAVHAPFPALSLGVAEVGATSESVAEAMVASQPEVPFVRSDGLLAGQEAIILEATYDHSGDWYTVDLATGEESITGLIFDGERTHRSQIFEQDGRVFIATISAFVEDFALMVAESGPLFDSLVTGGDG